LSALPYRQELAWAANALVVVGALLGILAYLELRRHVHELGVQPVASKAGLIAGLL
jgi:hypothetical protein